MIWIKSKSRGLWSRNVAIQTSMFGCAHRSPILPWSFEVADYHAVGRGPGFDVYREMCDTYDISDGCQTKLLEGGDASGMGTLLTQFMSDLMI